MITVAAEFFGLFASLFQTVGRWYIKYDSNFNIVNTVQKDYPMLDVEL